MVSSGNWYPLAILLIVAFVVGTVVSTVLGGFVNTSTPNPNSTIISSISSYINGSFTFDVNASLFGIPFIIPLPNFVALLPSSGQNYIVGQFNALSYMPDWLVVPFVILFVLAFIWTLIALVKPGSS